MTPSAVVEEDRHMANFLWKLKAEANCEGSAIRVRPSPAMPFAPLARPSRREVGAQEKRNLDTETDLPGFDPSVDWTDTASSASSSLEAVRVTVLSGRTLHVLLLHPGLGAEKQFPQPLPLASEHWADLHCARAV